jgi:hypothetical protein
MKKNTYLAAFAFIHYYNNYPKETASNKEAQTEKKCCAKEADSKAMTAAEVLKCQAKCKLGKNVMLKWQQQKKKIVLKSILLFYI